MASELTEKAEFKEFANDCPFCLLVHNVTYIQYGFSLIYYLIRVGT